MSRTLPFLDGLVKRGRHLQSLGLAREALRHWSRLAQMKSLPPALAEEAQNRLGDLHFQRQKYARASRHFTAALAHQPGNPHYHFLLAQATEEDPKGNPEKALEHYRRAVELDPDQPAYLAGYGRLAMDLNQEADGVPAMRRAAELAPDDPEVILTVLDGLAASHPAEAEGILRLSLFRNPRDPRFRKLWSDFHFQRLLAEQEENKTPAPRDEGSSILPFIPTAPSAKAPLGWRRHPAAAPTGPHFRLQSVEKKHA